MAKATVILKSVYFIQPADVGGQMRPFLATEGSPWTGWNLYADYNTREVLVAAPAHLPRNRVRVPFENVRQMEPGLQAPRDQLKELGLLTPLDS